MVQLLPCLTFVVCGKQKPSRPVIDLNVSPHALEFIHFKFLPVEMISVFLFSDVILTGIASQKRDTNA